jgi:hypothetical protein
MNVRYFKTCFFKFISKTIHRNACEKKRSISGKLNYAIRARATKISKIEDFNVINDLNRSIDHILTF